jgi:hypothetical protein
MGIILGPAFDRFLDGEQFARAAVAVTERHGFRVHQPGAFVLLQMATLWTRTIDEAQAWFDAADRDVSKVRGGDGLLVAICRRREHGDDIDHERTPSLRLALAPPPI